MSFGGSHQGSSCSSDTGWNLEELFHARATVTRKERSPMVRNRVLGTIRRNESRTVVNQSINQSINIRLLNTIDRTQLTDRKSVRR